MMSLEQWEKLYTYAEELWKLAPWKKIDDIELIGLQNGKKNDAVWVSTLGYHDSTYGAAFYQGVENLKGWYMIINQEEYGLDQMFTIFSQNMLTLYYGEKKEIPPQQEEILHSLKKKYKDGRIPYFYSMKECSVPVEPDDEELAQLLNSDTKIWLVQGETDSSVDPEQCSKRIWNIITNGAEITETHVDGDRGIGSAFTTYETADDKYKLSLYETFDLAEVTGISGETRQGGKLKFAEDYDQDGVYTEVKYSDHWSWIYTLRNNPEAADGTHIWEWAVK